MHNPNPENAWNRQKELQKIYSYEEVPSLEEIYNLILNITYGNVNINSQTLRAKALIAMYYITGCRLSEIVKSKKIDYDISLKDYSFKGVTKHDLKETLYNGKKVLFIRTKNRKHKTRKSKRQPIPLDFEYEYKIFTFIKEYCDTLQDTDVLFDFTNKRATQIINDTIGFNAHFIRHIRCTHLITLYDFNEQALIKFMGWSDSRPAKSYMELSPKTILNEFYKNSGGN